MKKKYLYNGQIMEEADVMDAAKQSNLDINTYIQKAGIKSINESYNLGGKNYSAEDVLDAANQSKLGFDDYIQKAGFGNSEKKNPSQNAAQNIGASASPTLSQSESEKEWGIRFQGDRVGNTVTSHDQPSKQVSPLDFTAKVFGINKADFISDKPIAKGVEDFNKDFENLTGYKNFDITEPTKAEGLRGLLSDDFYEKRKETFEQKKFKTYSKEKDKIDKLSEKVYFGEVKPAHISALQENPYTKNIANNLIREYVPELPSVQDGNPATLALAAKRINEKNRINYVAAETDSITQLDNSTSSLLADYVAKADRATDDIKELKEGIYVDDFNDADKISSAIQKIKKIDRLEQSYYNSVSLKQTPELLASKKQSAEKNADLLKRLNERLDYNISRQGVSKSFSWLNDKIDKAVLSKVSNLDKGEKTADVTTDELKLHQFKMGLSKIEKSNPVLYKNVTEAIAKEHTIDPDDFYIIANEGQKIDNRARFRQAAYDPSLIDTETDFDYTTFDQKVSLASGQIGEWMKEKGLTHFREYPKKVIEQAAKELGIENKDVVNTIAFNEKLLGYDQIPKTGWDNHIVAGFMQPIEGIVSTLRSVNESPAQTYLRSKSLTSGFLGTAQVPNEKGEYSNILPSDREKFSTDMWRGLGQFIPQVLLTKGVGGGLRGIGGIVGIGATAKQAKNIADFGGTFISTYLQSYGQAYQEHLQKTGDADLSALVGGIDAISASAFELLLPDVKIADAAMGSLKSGLTNDLIGLIKKGGNPAELATKARPFIQKFFNNATKTLTQENAEELGTQYVNFVTEAIFDPASAKDRNVSKELWDVFKATTASMLLPSIMGAAGGSFQKDFTTKSLHSAAINFDSYKSSLQKSLDKQYIDQNEFNKAIQLLKTHRESIAAVPEVNAEGDLLPEKKKLDYAYEDTKIKYFTEQAAGKGKVAKEVWENRIKESEEIQRNILMPKVADTKLSQPIEGLDAQGIPIGENVPEPTKDFTGKDNNYLANKEENFFTPEERATYNELMKTPETEGEAAKMVADKKSEIKLSNEEKIQAPPEETKTEEKPIEETEPLTKEENKTWDDLSLSEKAELARKNLPEVEDLSNSDLADLADKNAKRLLEKLRGEETTETVSEPIGSEKNVEGVTTTIGSEKGSEVVGDVAKVKVFRGTGKNVKQGENDAVQWVAEDRMVAENYSKEGKVEEMEVTIPSNPFEMPLNVIHVRGVDIANRLRTIRDKQFKDKIITRERALEISNAISDFEKKAGNELELYSTKTNKKESAVAFVNALKELGFDGLVQKESYNSESPFTNTITGNETNTYGIFKEQQPTSQQTGNSVEVKPEKTETGEVKQPTTKNEEPYKFNKDVHEDFTSKSGRQIVKKVNGILTVVDAKTGEPVVRETVTIKNGKKVKRTVGRDIEKKALAEYAENFDFTVGEKAPDVPDDFELANEEEGKRWAVENTSSPAELAAIFLDEHPVAPSLSTVEQFIAEFGIGKVTGDSYNEFGDRNNMNYGKAQHYISNKDGSSLDVIAQEMSDHYGIEITPEDVKKFIDRFPNGERDALKEGSSNTATMAADKFRELTGMDLTQAIAEKAVNQEFDKLNFINTQLLNDSYETEQQYTDARFAAENEHSQDQGKGNTNANELGEEGVQKDERQVTGGVIGRVASFISKVFGGKASEKVFVAKDEKSLIQKANELQRGGGNPIFMYGDVKTAKSVYDKAVRNLKAAEDKISQKQATQTGLFGKAAQGEMFGVGRDEAKDILDPLRQKVKEAKAEWDKEQQKAIQDATGQQTLFMFKEAALGVFAMLNPMTIKNSPTAVRTEQVSKVISKDEKYVIDILNNYYKENDEVPPKEVIDRALYLWDKFGRPEIAGDSTKNDDRAFATNEGGKNRMGNITNFDDFVAELAHAAQFVSGKEMDDRAYPSQAEKDKKEYDRKGSMEYKAHKEIEPILAKYIFSGDSTNLNKIAYRVSGQKEVLGFTFGGKIYLNGEHLNPNTPIHEAGHIWTEWAKQNDLKVYNKGIELVNGSKYLKDVKADIFYQAEAGKLPENEREQYFQHEALATAIGDKGAQFVSESRKAGFKEWLNNLWSNIKNAAGFKDISNKDFQNLTLDEFAKRAARDILSEEGATPSENLGSNPKALANRLVNAKGTPEASKEAIKKEGLDYEPQSQKEAEDFANSIIDELGIDEAVNQAQSGKFGGDVNTLVQAEALNRLAEMGEQAGKDGDKAAQREHDLKFAEVGIALDKSLRKQGQSISAINYFYKKSPLGIQLMENAKKKEDFDKWAKPKEKSWEDIFDEMMAEPDFKAAVNERVKKEIKKERSEARKDKKEKVHKAIDETMAKWAKKLSADLPPGTQKQGIGVEEIFNAVGATMKKAYDAGEAITKIVKDAVDFISEKLGHDNWDKEGFTKEWETQLGKDNTAYKESDTRHQARIDALNNELERIKKRKPKEPKEKKESTREIPEDEQKILDEIEKEQSIWDDEKDMARQVADDYQKLETERNRQLKRVGELNEKIDTLRQGLLPEGKLREPKPDTPEIEALKQEKDALETSVRESIAHEKNIKGLEKELQRLKDRKEKEPKPENKKVITADERLLRDEIEAERKAWDIENRVSKLRDDLQRVKDRQQKATTPADKRELSEEEKDLNRQIKAEKEQWSKEVEPERKLREALRAAQKSLDEYERRINTGDISKKTTDDIDSPELTALREKRDAKKEEYEAMKKGMLQPAKDADARRKRMEKFINRMKGLSQREKEELVQRAFNKIVSDGALEFPELRRMIAEVTGRGDMTPQEAARLRELVQATNAVDDAGERARTERTQEARVAFRIAEHEASAASKELNTLLYNRPNITRRLTAMLQLNTLGIPALVNNPIYNVWNQVTLRAPIGLVKTVIDQGIYHGGKLFGKDYHPETNVLSIQVQREFFKKLGLGTKEAFQQFVSGLDRLDYIQKEFYGQQIRPRTSSIELWEFFKDERNLTKAQFTDKLIQALPPAWTAEIIARTLNLGDKPQRFAAQAAQSSAFAKSLGLKDIDYDLFIYFPREEAYRVYKERELSDAEAGKKADYIKDTIIKEGERSTFQQDNMVNDLLNRIFGKDSGVGGLLKATVISPYIKIPSNAYWSYFNIVNPEVAMLQSMIYGLKAYAKQNWGYERFTVLGLGDKKNTTAAKDFNEAKYWMAHAAVGFATRAVIMSLVAAGVYNPSNTEDDTKKEREGEQTYETPGSINISKLWAILHGEDPSKVKNGITIQTKWFGHWGSIGNTIARREQEMTPEQKENREDYWHQMLGLMGESGLKEFGQGVFGNTSSLLTALDRGGATMQAWGVNTMNLFTNIIHPAAFAQMSKAQLPYYTKTRADGFMEELKNAMLTRSSWLRDLTGQYPPSKVGIWGDKIEKNDGSITTTMKTLFGISKARDDNFAQPIYEDYKKTNDIRFFPSAVMPTLKVEGQTFKLNNEESRRLEELVGSERKKLVAPYINDMANLEGFKKPYSQLTPDEKIDALKIFYDAGYNNGKLLFIGEKPQFNVTKGKEQVHEEKEESKMLKQLRAATKRKSPVLQ